MEEEQQYTAKIGGDNLVTITNNKLINTRSEIFGYGNNSLVINYDPTFRSIISIECTSSDEIIESIYSISQFSKLKKRYVPFLRIDPKTYDEFNRLYFLLVYNHNALNIVFKNKDDISEYYSSDRVDFYYDKDSYICGIRIRNLTKEEYNILKHEELEPGYYMNHFKESKKK